jgi:hypothetical protein
MLGSGTELDPYIIENVTDLQNIQNHLAAWYELESDIDAAETVGWNGGAGFYPLGIFTGHFDGKDYSILDLYINRPTESNIGLFSYIQGTVINLIFKNSYVYGKTDVGTLARGITGTVSEVHVQNGYVKAPQGPTYSRNSYIGGLFGEIGQGGNVEDSDFEGTIYTSACTVVGGFTGHIYGGTGTIARCHVNASVYNYGTNNRADETGGFVGRIIGALGIRQLEEYYSTGQVVATRYGTYIPLDIGGFAGIITQGTCQDCFSLSIVNGDNGQRIGGFVGQLNYIACLDNVYSAGHVIGAQTGGLVGVNAAPGSCFVTDSFWDIQTSGQATSAGGTGKTTEQMKTEATFTDAGWDFLLIWGISPLQNFGYPFFLWAFIDIIIPRLSIEYTPATPPVPPKLTIDFESEVEPVPPKLIIEHEFRSPVPPKLVIEHEAAIEPVPPKLIIEHELPIEALPPKLTIEYVKPTIPEEITPGIQIYVDEEWQEISQYVMSLHIKRGRMHELDRVEAGTSVMILNNETGVFWRYNPDSLYFPEIKPIIRVRIVMALGEVSYSLFNGLVEAWRPSWSEDISGGLPVMTIECVDMFKRFSRAYIREARLAELPGQRINAVLTHIGWPVGEGWRAIDPGCIMIAELPLDEANPENALQHMLDVAQSESGILFMDGEGKVVFQDSNSRITGEYSVTKATLTKDDFLPVQLSDDDTMIYNAAQVNSQLYQVPDIDPLIGSREYKETLPISTETDALARAYMIAQRYKDSILRLPSIPILPANNPERLFPMAYGYELSTRITIELDDPQYPAKIEQTYHIEGIQHKWDARSKLWRTEWQVWEVSQFRRGLILNSAWAVCHRIIYQSIPGYVGVWPHPGNLDPYNNDVYIEVGQFSGLEDIWISRALIEVDTSSINADVLEAHVFLCFHIATHGELDRDIKIVLVDPESLTCPMQTGDYGSLRTKNTILGESAAFHSARDGDWIEIELNAAGIYYINKGGTTVFGIRTDHDINADDDDLVSGTIKLENARFCGYGTGKEPYLVAKLNI